MPDLSEVATVSTRPPPARRSLPVAAAEAAACTACGLHESRSQVVFGAGDPGAELLVVGAAPARTDDVLGAPFTGAAGNLVTNLLADNGLSRDDVYLTNLVKCRPNGDRAPRPDEVAACGGYLRDEIGNVRPRVIVTLGEMAARLLLRKPVPLVKVAGYRFTVLGATLVPTYHPVEALRGNPTVMGALKRDIAVAAATLRSAGAATT